MDKLDFWSRRHPKKVHFERTLIADKEANSSNIQAQNLIYRLGSWNTVRWSMILRNGNPYTLINLCSSALNIIGGFSQIHSHTYFYLKLKRNRKSNFKWFFLRKGKIYYKGRKIENSKSVRTSDLYKRNSNNEYYKWPFKFAHDRSLFH